jgi:hypothetical protein
MLAGEDLIFGGEMNSLKVCVVLGMAAAGLAACDSPMFHQDRPGGSDYQGGYYRGDGGSGRYGERQRDREDTARYNDRRDYCARDPYASDCRR